MKNLKTNKIIVTLAIVLSIILGLTISSFADDNVQVINPSDVIGGSGSSSSGSNSNANTGSNTNANSNRTNNTNSNRINNVNNSSSYNNTNLPSTGLADHTPLFVIVGVLAVVAIIAYKKVKYYKGI